MSAVDRFDGDPTKLKQWLKELIKLMEDRDADLPAKKNLVYLRTTCSFAEYVKQRIHLLDSWEEFVYVLLARYDVLQTPPPPQEAWHMLASIRQIPQHWLTESARQPKLLTLQRNWYIRWPRGN